MAVFLSDKVSIAGSARMDAAVVPNDTEAHLEAVAPVMAS